MTGESQHTLKSLMLGPTKISMFFSHHLKQELQILWAPLRVASLVEN